MIVLSIGSIITSDAREACNTVYFTCGNGSGGYGLVCFSGPMEYIVNCMEMQSVICSN